MRGCVNREGSTLFTSMFDLVELNGVQKALLNRPRSMSIDIAEGNIILEILLWFNDGL